MDNKDIKLLIGKRIKKQREARHLTQAQLAELLELSANFVGMVERGERNTTFTNIYKIVYALGISLEEFFKGI